METNLNPTSTKEKIQIDCETTGAIVGMPSGVSIF